MSEKVVAVDEQVSDDEEVFEDVSDVWVEEAAVLRSHIRSALACPGAAVPIKMGLVATEELLAQAEKNLEEAYILIVSARVDRDIAKDELKAKEADLLTKVDSEGNRVIDGRNAEIRAAQLAELSALERDRLAQAEEVYQDRVLILETAKINHTAARDRLRLLELAVSVEA